MGGEAEGFSPFIYFFPFFLPNALTPYAGVQQPPYCSGAFEKDGSYFFLVWQVLSMWTEGRPLFWNVENHFWAGEQNHLERQLSTNLWSQNCGMEIVITMKPKPSWVQTSSFLIRYHFSAKESKDAVLHSEFLLVLLIRCFLLSLTLF